MELAKLKILVEERKFTFSKDGFPVLYNPSELKLDKTANWSRVPTAGRNTTRASFTHGDAYSLSVDLFFDTYETGEDVTDYTKRIVELATVQGQLSRPPLCRLVWGNNNTFDGLTWALQSLNQRFTLFLPGGRPVRAILGCSFREWRSPELEDREKKRISSDVARTRVLKRGESLSSIAAEEYNDPGLWRAIAELNGIHNPRRIAPGQVLAIPPVKTGRRS